jgi:Outer membrane protein beta-barrel domain
MRKLLFSILILISSHSILSGQSQNLHTYYYEKVHFGFFLGVNRANFLITPVQNLRVVGGDSIKTILSSPKTGFNLGIVSEFAFIPYATIRFVPDIAFGSRNVEFHVVSATDTVDYVKEVESTFLNFPINLKVRSKRYTNFAAYIIGGGRYTLDLASQKDVNNNVSVAQQVIKLSKHDFAYEAGAGVDFFLPYFKFGIEVKASLGLKNMLVRSATDTTVFTNSLDRLRSKVFLVSFTFEG